MLNPLNSEAQVNAVVTTLNAPGTPDLDALSKAARQMISTSRGDARSYSILGAVEERAGQGETAEEFYSVALRHSKSELHALLRLADIRMQAGNVPAALDNIDLLLRRWPGYWNQVQPILVAAATRPDGSDALIEKLNGQPPWRGRAVATLAAAPATLGAARDLVVQAPAGIRASGSWQGERDTVINALVRAKAYADAYGLFLSTLTEDEAKLAGYVFDGKFTQPSRRGYFNWRTQKPGAVDIGFGDSAAQGAGGLAVRFLDSPARPGIVSQNLLLPLGSYRLSVDVATDGLSAPKGLFWRLACSEGQSLGQLDIPPGTAGSAVLTLDFDVPTAGCSRQTLSLDTAVKTDSWRDRYQGEARFESLVIARL